MFKKALSIVLAMFLVFGLCSGIPSAFAAEVSDDFSDASAAAWQTFGAGQMNIKDGEMQLSSAARNSETVSLYNGLNVGDFTAEFTYRFVEGQNDDSAAFIYRTNDNASTGYVVYFVHCPDEHRQYYTKLTYRDSTGIHELKGAGLPEMFYTNVDYDKEVQVKLTVSGGVHSLYMTTPGNAYGEPLWTYSEEGTPKFVAGRIGFLQWQGPNGDSATTAYDNLKVTADAVSGGEVENPDKPVNPPVDGDELLFTDFSDGSTAGWKSYGIGQMNIKDGEMQLSSTARTSETLSIYKELNVGDFVAEFTYRFIEGKNDDSAAFIYHTNDYGSTGYVIYFTHCPDEHRQYYTRLTYRDSTGIHELKGAGLPEMFFTDIDYDKEVQVKVTVTDGVHSLYMTTPGNEYGEPLWTYSEDGEPKFAGGRIGFLQWQGPNGDSVTTAYDNLKLTGEIVSSGVVENPDKPTEPPVVTGDTVAIDFSDGSATDWQTFGIGQMTMIDEEMQLSSAAGLTDIGALYKKLNVKDFTAEFTYRFIEGKNDDGAALIYRSNESGSTAYIIYFVHCPDEHRQYYTKLVYRDNTGIYELKGAGLPEMFFTDIDYDKEVQVKVTVSGGVHCLYMTTPGNEYGQPLWIYSEAGTPKCEEGLIGFMQWHGPNGDSATTAYDNLKITGGTERNPGSDVLPPMVDVEFTIQPRYTDVTVDNDNNLVKLTRSLTVAELKDSFKVTKGFTAKVLRADGSEVTDGNEKVVSGMELVFSAKGAEDQMYTVQVESANIGIWIAVGAGVICVAVILVVSLLCIKKSRAKKNNK